MSRENAIKFYEEVKNSENLKKEFEGLRNQVESGKETREKSLAKKIVSLAKKNGFDFTEKELLSYMEEVKGTLSEKELLSVSGGVSPKALGVGMLGALMLTLAGGAVVSSSAMTNEPGAYQAYSESDIEIESYSNTTTELVIHAKYKNAEAAQDIRGTIDKFKKTSKIDDLPETIKIYGKVSGNSNYHVYYNKLKNSKQEKSFSIDNLIVTNSVGFNLNVFRNAFDSNYDLNIDLDGRIPNFKDEEECKDFLTALTEAYPSITDINFIRDVKINYMGVKVGTVKFKNGTFENFIPDEIEIRGSRDKSYNMEFDLLLGIKGKFETDGFNEKDLSGEKLNKLIKNIEKLGKLLSNVMTGEKGTEKKEIKEVKKNNKKEPKKNEKKEIKEEIKEIKQQGTQSIYLYDVNSTCGYYESYDMPYYDVTAKAKEKPDLTSQAKVTAFLEALKSQNNELSQTETRYIRNVTLKTSDVTYTYNFEDGKLNGIYENRETKKSALTPIKQQLSNQKIKFGRVSTEVDLEGNNVYYNVEATADKEPDLKSPEKVTAFLEALKSQNNELSQMDTNLIREVRLIIGDVIRVYEFENGSLKTQSERQVIKSSTPINSNNSEKPKFQRAPKKEFNIDEKEIKNYLDRIEEYTWDEKEKAITLFVNNFDSIVGKNKNTLIVVAKVRGTKKLEDLNNEKSSAYTSRIVIKSTDKSRSDSVTINDVGSAIRANFTRDRLKKANEILEKIDYKPKNKPNENAGNTNTSSSDAKKGDDQTQGTQSINLQNVKSTKNGLFGFTTYTVTATADQALDLSSEGKVTAFLKELAAKDNNLSKYINSIKEVTLKVNGQDYTYRFKDGKLAVSLIADQVDGSKYDIVLCDCNLNKDNPNDLEKIHEIIRKEANISKDKIRDICTLKGTKEKCDAFLKKYRGKGLQGSAVEIINKVKKDISDATKHYDNVLNVYVSVEEWWCQLKKVVIVEINGIIKEFSIKLNRRMRNGEVIRATRGKEDYAFRIIIEHPFIRLNWIGNKCDIIYYITPETYKEGLTYARHPSGTMYKINPDIMTTPATYKGAGVNGGDFIIKYAKEVPKDMKNLIVSDCKKMHIDEKKADLRAIGIRWELHDDGLKEYKDEVEENPTPSEKKPAPKETFEKYQEYKETPKRKAEMNAILAQMQSYLDALNSNVQFVQDYGNGTLLFRCNGQDIVVQLTEEKYGAGAIKTIGNNNGYPVEFVVYKENETNDDKIFENHKNATECATKTINVIIPSEYKGTYFPFIIGHRGDYELDRPELPIILPIPVKKDQKKYTLVYANPYKGNINDRFKVNVEFN